MKTTLPKHRGGRFYTMPLKRARMRCERTLLWEYTYTTPPQTRFSLACSSKQVINAVLF